MSQPRVLYCGDTSIDSAAAYLTGLMTHWGWEFDYLPSDQPLSVRDIPSDAGLFVFSDYPAGQADHEVQQQILQRIGDGAGLLMIGGWESFQGLGGHWEGTPLAEALPVEISADDDRRNCDQPVFVRPIVASHAITRDLPWSERPPLIGGFNAFEPKAGSETLLEAVIFDATLVDSVPSLQQQSTSPLLVTGFHGSGRTAALATDVAPHWIGPMVDWGTERVTACAAGAEAIEVGNLYAAFFRNLLSWTARFRIEQNQDR